MSTAIFISYFLPVGAFAWIALRPAHPAAAASLISSIVATFLVLPASIPMKVSNFSSRPRGPDHTPAIGEKVELNFPAGLHAQMLHHFFPERHLPSG